MGRIVLVAVMSGVVGGLLAVAGLLLTVAWFLFKAVSAMAGG